MISGQFVLRTTQTRALLDRLPINCFKLKKKKQERLRKMCFEQFNTVQHNAVH